MFSSMKISTLRKLAFTLFAMVFILVCALVGSKPGAATPAHSDMGTLSTPAGIKSRMMTTGTGLECMVFQTKGTFFGASCNWQKFNEERGGL